MHGSLTGHSKETSLKHGSKGGSSLLKLRQHCQKWCPFSQRSTNGRCGGQCFHRATLAPKSRFASHPTATLSPEEGSTSKCTSSAVFTRVHPVGPAGCEWGTHGRLCRLQVQHGHWGPLTFFFPLLLSSSIKCTSHQVCPLNVAIFQTGESCTPSLRYRSVCLAMA